MKLAVILVTCVCATTPLPEEYDVTTITPPPGVSSRSPEEALPMMSLFEAWAEIIIRTVDSAVSSPQVPVVTCFEELLDLMHIKPQFEFQFGERDFVHEIKLSLLTKAPMMSLDQGLDRFVQSRPSESRIMSVAPKLLAISADRFQTDFSKRNNFVFYYPETLRLDQLAMRGEGSYRLVGIVHSFGPTIDRLTHQAEFRNPEDGKWFRLKGEILVPGAHPSNLGFSQTGLLYERL